MDAEHALRQFRERFRADLARGQVAGVEAYQADAPGFEAEVAAEYARLTTAESDETLADPGATASAPTDPRSASTVPGLLAEGEPRYSDEGEIARGAMGAIVRIHDEALDRSLAKKLILPHGSGHPELIARFLDEARVTAQLDHPGVVPVHDVGLDATGRVFFTMKLVEGRTFEDVIDEVHAGRGDWTLQRAVQTFLRICETLAFAHARGVVHRDLKPANIMVGAFGEVYVMDWGLAKLLPRTGDTPSEAKLPSTASSISGSRADATVAGTVIGTPAYMPPEQAAGDQDRVVETADIYALGAVLYHLLSGTIPYAEDGLRRSAMETVEAVLAGPPAPLSARASQAPLELVAIAERAMARDPGERYATAEELRSDVEAFLENRVVRAYRTGPLVELSKWIARNRSLAVSAALLLALTLGGTIAFGIYQDGVAETMREQRDRETQAKLAAEQARDREARARADADAARAEEALARSAAETAREEEAEARRLAEQAREEEAAARNRADGMRLLAEGDNLLDSNPAWSLGVAAEGARKAPGTAANGLLYRALIELAEHRVLRGQDGAPRFVRFTADAARAIAAGRNGYPYASLWDTRSGELVGRLDEHTGWAIHDLQLSPDGHHVLTCGDDGTAKLWDLRTLECVRTVDEHRSAVLCVAFSATGEWFATGTRDGVVRVFETHGDADPVRRHDGHERGVVALSFSPHDQRLLVLAGDGTCSLALPMDRPPEKLFQLDVGGFEPPAWDPEPLVGWLPDGGNAIAWLGRQVGAWDLHNGGMIESLTQSNAMRPAWSAGGTTSCCRTRARRTA